MKTIPKCMVLTMSRKAFSILSKLRFMDYFHKQRKNLQIEDSGRSRLALVLQRVEREHILCGLRGEKCIKGGKKNPKGVLPRSGIKSEVAITGYFVIYKKGNTCTALPCILKLHASHYCRSFQIP